jgi:hypothetical protein
LCGVSCRTYTALPPPMTAPVRNVRLPHTTRSLRVAAAGTRVLVPLELHAGNDAHAVSCITKTVRNW